MRVFAPLAAFFHFLAVQFSGRTLNEINTYVNGPIPKLGCAGSERGGAVSGARAAMA
jgi:hypothetical protein